MKVIFDGSPQEIVDVLSALGVNSPAMLLKDPVEHVSSAQGWKCGLTGGGDPYFIGPRGEYVGSGAAG